MTFTCPECGGRLWMRATRVVAIEFGLLGGIRERLIGFNAVCAEPQCSTVCRVDGNGARRLGAARQHVPKGPQDAAPPEPDRKPRSPIELNRTPTQQWTREPRE